MLQSITGVYPRSMGCPSQNAIIFTDQQKNDYIQRHLRLTDIFMSVYAFASINMETLQIARESAIIDKIFFDLDSENALKDVLKIHVWCKKRNIMHKTHFSGNGLHVFIPISNDVQHKREAVGNFQRWIQKELDITIDKKIIGDTSRIFRVPNTYNFKGLRYCVPIPAEILDSPVLSMDWLKRYATKQQFTQSWTGSNALNLQLFDVPEMLYNESKLDQINLDAIQPAIATEFAQFPPCVQNWLSTATLDGNAKFYLINYLRDQLVSTVPYSEEDILAILKRTLSVDEFQHYFGGKHLRGHEGHYGIKFKHIFQTNYFLPSCIKIQQKGLCPKDCGRSHPIS